MNEIPESIPAHEGCSRGCTDCCKTARHIGLVQTDEKVHDDLKSEGIQTQLEKCGHLEDDSSPHHTEVVELMSWVKERGTQTVSELFTKLGFTTEQAGPYLDDGEDDDPETT